VDAVLFLLSTLDWHASLSSHILVQVLTARFSQNNAAHDNVQEKIGSASSQTEVSKPLVYYGFSIMSITTHKESNPSIGV